MSIFSFPRLHIKGLIRCDVGTANNDDYSNSVFPPGSPHAGQPVRLADSNCVRALTYGKTDAEWVEWVQQVGQFANPPAAPAAATPGPAPARAVRNKAEGVLATAGTVPLVPAEWNYYGNMAFDLGFVNGGKSYDVRVIGVQYPDRVATKPGEDPYVGTVLSFRNRPDAQTGRSTGMLIDVNPESVPCSQVFADSLLLQDGDRPLLLGKPSKAVTRWINFQRNTNLGGPNGAGCALQCVVPLDQLRGQPILDFFAQGKPLPPTFRGVVFRYYVGRSLQVINTYKYPGSAWLQEIVALYAKKGKNPTYLEVVGTLSGWYEGEMQSVTTGRLLGPTDKTVPVPQGSRGNGPQFRLAPAAFQVDPAAARVSVDFSGTFPDQYQGTDFDPFRTGNNPKYDFGAVRLLVTGGGTEYDFGPVKYQDTDAGDRIGWVFDFPLGQLSAADRQLVDGGTFVLRSAKYGDLLAEQETLIASDQSCVFGEQDVRPRATADRFMNDGPVEVPATIRVFVKGREQPPAASPAVTVWEYDTTPNQVPGKRVKLSDAYGPGTALCVPDEGSGNRLYTFTLPGQPEPPATTDGLDLMMVPMINLRLLPNDTDYSQYYVDPSVSQPVGNDKLTFAVIYEEVLRNYYLLYPAMSQVVPLNDPDRWSNPEMAGRLMQRTQKDWFDKAEYMPRTRDLSDSRRRLLHAWCLKFRTGGT
jgi:hypothetical protein